MSVYTKRARDIFAPVNSAGQPRQVDNGEAVVWGTEIESVIGSFLTNGGLIYDTRASLFGDLAHPANRSAWVIGDPTAANNGIYRKLGGVGAGSWVRVADLPYGFIRLLDAGAGTANAILATSSLPLPVAPSAAMLVMNVFEPNTGPVTISVNGAPPKPLRTSSGSDLGPGYLAGSMTVAFLDQGASFRLLSDVASAAIQAAAEAAADRAEAAVAVVAQRLFETKADLAAATVDPSVDVIQVAGDAAPGDGGDVLLTRVASVPAHSGYVLDNSGSVFAITKRTVRASQFGAFPSAGARVGLIQALAYLEAVGGGCLEIDKDGDYTVSGSVELAGFSSHIRIENKAGGVIKAAAGLADPVMSFASGTTAPGNGRLTTHGLRIDNSAGFYGVGVQSCTGLEIHALDQDTHYDFECIGGYDALVGITASGGDSGMSHVLTRVTRIFSPSIERQPDAALYPNWDNSGDIGGYFEVNGGRYFRNNIVLTAKRNLKEVAWFGGILEENTGGLTTQWVNNGGWVHPARKLMADGVLFKKTLANVVTIKGPNGKGGAVNCTVEDVGYKYDASGNVGANASAFIAHGASGLIFKNNTFRMSAWSPVNEVAFLNRPDTDSGITYTGGGHDIGGNNLDNWTRYATGPGAPDAGVASVHGPETFGAVMPADGSAFSSTFHPNSLVTYRRVGESSERFRLGGVNYIKGAQRSINAVAAGKTLSADESGKYFTNAGATGLAAFSLPGAAAGLTYEFSCMDTDGLRVVAAAGDVIRVAGTVSVAGGRIDNAALGTYIKLTAQDSTNWVAEGAQGTWTVT